MCVRVVVVVRGGGEYKINIMGFLVTFLCLILYGPRQHHLTPHQRHEIVVIVASCMFAATTTVDVIAFTLGTVLITAVTIIVILIPIPVLVAIVIVGRREHVAVA